MMKNTSAALALAVAAVLLLPASASAAPLPGTADVGTARVARAGEFWAYVPIQFVEELIGEWTEIPEELVHPGRG
ncbi:hypothetical protein GCM10020229_05070 [Kitasatospora albolonga]|uniref:hypothetical protein n=1 Tax=Kitasatospora albolonga TaxID=68173 RepID=UPI0031EF78AC